jgi:CTP-dependent riboflavin kinase
MIILKGTVVAGIGDFTKRMTNFPEAFRKATGEELVKGTLNVKVAKPVEVRPHFRIRGQEIGEDGQDLLFEVCRINGIWAYRIRPFNLRTREGGHGNTVLEICCAQWIPNATVGSVVEVTLFRDDAIEGCPSAPTAAI